MHLNFNCQAVSTFLHGSKALLELFCIYMKAIRRNSHTTSSERTICSGDSLVRQARMSVVMVSMPANCWWLQYLKL